MNRMKRPLLLLTILLPASLACRFTASDSPPAPVATTQASSTPLPLASEYDWSALDKKLESFPPIASSTKIAFGYSDIDVGGRRLV